MNDATIRGAFSTAGSLSLAACFIGLSGAIAGYYQPLNAASDLKKDCMMPAPSGPTDLGTKLLGCAFWPGAELGTALAKAKPPSLSK